MAVIYKFPPQTTKEQSKFLIIFYSVTKTHPYRNVGNIDYLYEHDRPCNIMKKILKITNVNGIFSHILIQHNKAMT
jgi:hypothetical protein